MNTEEIKTFIVLSKVKNFTLAAEQMFIAQSTVTNRISELEKEVGKKLFARGSKSVSLTEEGKIFLKYAERIIELQESSVAEMNAVKAYRQSFAIGANNAAYETYVKDVVDACLTHRDVSVKLMLGHSLDLIQQLQDNVLDIVFSFAPFKRKGYVTTVYDEDRLVLVTARIDEEFAGGITKEQLLRVPYLLCNFTSSNATEFVRDIFPESHVFKLEVDNSSKLSPYLEKGLGYSFLPYKLIKDKLENGELEEVKLKDFEAPIVTTYLI
jgi:LysR family transcriptional repressor of citA